VQSYSAVVASRGFLYFLEGVFDDMILSGRGNGLGWWVPRCYRSRDILSISVDTAIVSLVHDVGGYVWPRLRIVLRYL
jgi:hypothetical protein